MGRELCVDRIDFLRDGNAIIRCCPDFYVCGRTDFTSAIANLFYNKGVYHILISSENFDYKKIHVTVEDEAESSFEEKEFDLEFSTTSREEIESICNDYMIDDEKELARENAMLNDAYCARRNTSTVKDFEAFSDLIDELEKHIDNYCEDARLYLNYINKVNLCHSDDVKASYILLTLSE